MAEDNEESITISKRDWDQLILLLGVATRAKDDSAPVWDLFEFVEEIQARLAEPYCKPTQHCVSEECTYTFSHTAQWCGHKQTRRCCHWCYPNDPQFK